MRIERMRNVKIVVVTSKPPEGFAIGYAFEVRSVDEVIIKDLLFARAKVSSPSIFSHLPKGVSTASKATEPTTSNDMRS